jgi:alpha-1,2-mannosyltransferase
MAEFTNRWRALCPPIRALCVFLLLNSVGLNLLLAALPWTPGRKTVFNYTARTVMANGGTDSWGQMATALAEFRARPEGALYHDVFTRRHIRFPYPPTSLLLTDAIEHLGLGFACLNLVSVIAVLATIAVVAALLIGGFEHGASTGLSRADRNALFVVAVASTLTFYPIVKGFALGQIQTWINLVLGLVLWLWTSGRQRGAGVLAAVTALLKPHYGFMLLWAASRRRWTFCISFGATIVLTGVVSLWVFGLRTHLDYLWMLSYVSRHGESYFANNAVNGFLHRLLFNGENLEWHEDRYPPMNGWVVGGTLVASATLVALCLLWRRRTADAGGIVDLMSAVLTCVMASPVAWEHHYGVLLPIYAVLLPMVLRSPGGPVMWLATSYVLSSNYFGVTRLAAGTWLNFVQSSLLFGAAMVLLCLYRSRASPSPGAS